VFLDRIRVLVADDEPVVRAALEELVEAEETLELVGVAKDAQEAIDLAIREHPDVALLDVKMPAGGGPRAAREIRNGSLQTRVIALSAYEDRTSVLEMLRAGAVGYLVKGTRGVDIVKMVHNVTRGDVVLSSEVMRDILEEFTGRLQIEGEEEELLRTQSERIRDVLDKGRLSMVFQPIVDLEAEAVVGFEALARFPFAPDRPVESWFTEAAAVGLRRELELAAVDAALAVLPEIPAELYLSVNAMPDTLASAGLTELLTTVPADRLVLEITEHAPVHDYDALNKAMQRMRRRGIRLAVDDAGSGFASLRHILQLGPDIIKIDNALTRNVYKDPARRALAAGLISFAAELGATIVAEGIQSLQELDALRELGVRFGQGFYLGRPGPIADAISIGVSPVRGGGGTAFRGW
jgi:EAL domain-containing protein (putative c-di-GMP-specific phosphodiesterase class I)/FixJ family two-component response regulator